MARFCGIMISTLIVAGCSTGELTDRCKFITSPPKGIMHAAVYVHALGPDYLFAYQPGCEEVRLESVKMGKLKNDEEIFYIINRSEAGFSVPYAAEIVRDPFSDKPVVSLLRRDTSSKEIKFRGVDPPPPP